MYDADSDKNKELFDVYCRHLPNLYQLREQLRGKLGERADQFSYPHLIYISSEQDSLRHKLFVVGKDPRESSLDRFVDKSGGSCGRYLGSSPLDKTLESLNVGAVVRELMDQDKHFSRRQYGKPFLETAIRLNGQMNPGSPDNSFAYSNAVKVSLDGKTPDKDIALEVCRAFPVLVDEVEIARPDVLVFFTGPDLDSYLQTIFAGLKFYHLCIEGIGWHDLCLLEHNKLPSCTFRAYHPGYSKRNKAKLNRVLSLIVSLVQGVDECSSPRKRLLTFGKNNYDLMNPGDIDRHHFVLLARKGDYSLWEHPQAKEYHLCDRKKNYEPIARFEKKVEALAALQQMGGSLDDGH